MKLNNNVYDALKWVALVLLPALGAAYFTIAAIWGLPNAEQVVGTIVCLDTLLGALLGVSTATYNKTTPAFDGTVIVNTTNPAKDLYTFDLGDNLERLPEMKTVVLNVKHADSQ